jgi:hypothetical protein
MMRPSGGVRNTCDPKVIGGGAAYATSRIVAAVVAHNLSRKFFGFAGVGRSPDAAYNLEKQEKQRSLLDKE